MVVAMVVRVIALATVIVTQSHVTPMMVARRAPDKPDDATASASA